MAKVLLSLSGGMDSGTLLGHALSQGHEVHTVQFQYGSKHNEYELTAVNKLLLHFPAVKNHTQLNLGFMADFDSNLLKTGGDIPEGHYEQSNMSQTVVPGRNIIFASILAGLAWSKDLDEVWLGIHSGDHAIYPDCRPSFFFAMKNAIEEGTNGDITMTAPFLHDNKTSILARGFKIQFPYELTRTCYADQPLACGKCGACQERLEAFRNHDIPDPIEYATREPLPKGGDE